MTAEVPMLRCAAVSRVLGDRSRVTAALRDVDLDIRSGESVAVVGRSGSGKSTLVGVLAGLDRPDAGRMLVEGHDVWAGTATQRRAARRRVGLVFQDVASSFNPRWTVQQVVAEGLHVDQENRVGTLLSDVGLDPGIAARRPRTLSGGERQRVALARALSTRPAVLLADELTTGLDVIAQELVLELVDRIRREAGLTVVLVTHDPAVAARVTDRVVVMAAGRIVEQLACTDLAAATHPASLELLAARPTTSPGRRATHRAGAHQRPRRGA